MENFPITDLGGPAQQIHEMYMELMAAGFTSDQAFELTKIVLGGQYG